jgi:predicted transcriptional regulator
MEKNNPKRKRPGRPRRGNVKVTFKLSPDVLKILQLTRRTLNRGKSELVEEALRQYLHMAEGIKKSKPL